MRRQRFDAHKRVMFSHSTVSVDSICGACQRGLGVTVSMTIIECPRAEVHGGVEVAGER